MCPFDSNNLEEQGLMFIGWHGNIRQNMDSIQEQVTARPPSADSSWFDDGFFCYDNLMIARQEAELQSLRCRRELNNDDSDDCGQVMCGIFADKKWFLYTVRKAFVDRDNHGYWDDPTSRLRVVERYHGYPENVAFSLFSYVHRSGLEMSLKIPSNYTSGLIAVCAPDQMARKFSDWSLSEVRGTFDQRQHVTKDTLQILFGKYYKDMTALSYYEKVVDKNAGDGPREEWNVGNF
ncbi:hypothetical protein BKA69DRAFT_1106550, partial [Paraphysoderma sedebokerense]